MPLVAMASAMLIISDALHKSYPHLQNNALISVVVLHTKYILSLEGNKNTILLLHNSGMMAIVRE